MLMTYYQWLAMRGDDAARKVLDSYFRSLVLISFVTGALTGGAAIAFLYLRASGG